MSPYSPVVGNLYLPMWAACFNLPSCPCGLVAHVAQLRLSYCFPEEWPEVVAVQWEIFQTALEAQNPGQAVCGRETWT